MAFDRQFLSRIGGSGNSGAAWIYTSNQVISEVIADGFFSDAQSELKTGDIIFLVDRLAPDGPAATLSFVKFNNGTLVKVGSGTNIPLTA